MVAKALLCKIKLLFKKKKQRVKNDLSVSSPLQQYRRWPCHSLCSGRVRGPLLSQRPGLKVNMDLWTYPMIIPRAVSCEGWGGVGGRWFLYKKKRKTDQMMRARWEVKSLHLGRTGRHRSRDQHAGHLFWNPFTRFMPWVVKSLLPPPPYSDSLLHRSPFWLSIIKDGILTGSYRENGCHIWWRGLREYDRLKRSCIPQCIRPPHYLYGMLLKPGQGQNRICWLLFKRIQ